MLHKNRVFSVSRETDVDELAKKLTQQTWTLCTGFRITIDGKDVFFLNDSFSEDGAQEYAVFRDGRQIESITFGWIEDPAEGARYIRDCANSDLIETMMQEEMPSLDHPEDGCRNCR